MSPLAIDTDATFDYVLRSDLKDDVPIEQRPTFMLRHLSMRQFRVVEFRGDSIGTDETGKALTGGETLDALLKLVSESVVGWRNMGRLTGQPDDNQPIPFDLGKLDDLITMAEAWELYHGILAGWVPTADDVKKSDSPSSSSTDSSANDAEADPST